MRPVRPIRRISGVLAASLLTGVTAAALAVCGPFGDVSDSTFCPLVQELFYLGITTGTTPTTYSPGDSVNRLQMAAFLSRTVDTVLQRGSLRAALGHFWTPTRRESLWTVTLGYGPVGVAFDGMDLWVSNTYAGVYRVRASDGRLLETWTGGGFLQQILPAMGTVFVTGATNVGKLYSLNPTQPAGALTEVATGLGGGANGIAFDGDRIWTANNLPYGEGSVSIITPGPSIPWTVTTITTGFVLPLGILYDGSHIWVTDSSAGTLLKLDRDGSILQTVTIGARAGPGHPVFDGANIWVPNNGAFTTGVVRASTGAVLMNLPGNGQNFPNHAAFDGERILVSSQGTLGGGAVSLWKAADLTPLGSFTFPPHENPQGVCSDGLNFWITVDGFVDPRLGLLARF
ncbi:MAG TPA: hypothetical protein VGQ32_03945 [Thermoanaerobaculia bacterium]|nr:hypothetical protein [Thermoanaerobaculia bacterium]